MKVHVVARLELQISPVKLTVERHRATRAERSLSVALIK
jgi:hypothetical protein